MNAYIITYFNYINYYKLKFKINKVSNDFIYVFSKNNAKLFTLVQSPNNNLEAQEHNWFKKINKDKKDALKLKEVHLIKHYLLSFIALGINYCSQKSFLYKLSVL